MSTEALCKLDRKFAHVKKWTAYINLRSLDPSNCFEIDGRLSTAEEKTLRKAPDVRETKFSKRRESDSAWRLERGRDPLAPITGYCDHVMPMTLLALNTGLLRGEIAQLTWPYIDLAVERVTVRAGYAKSGKARHVPLNSEAVTTLT